MKLILSKGQPTQANILLLYVTDQAPMEHQDVCGVETFLNHSLAEDFWRAVPKNRHRVRVV